MILQYSNLICTLKIACYLLPTLNSMAGFNVGLELSVESLSPCDLTQKRVTAVHFMSSQFIPLWLNTTLSFSSPKRSHPNSDEKKPALFHGYGRTRLHPSSPRRERRVVEAVHWRATLACDFSLLSSSKGHTWCTCGSISMWMHFPQNDCTFGCKTHMGFLTCVFTLFCYFFK